MIYSCELGYYRLWGLPSTFFHKLSRAFILFWTVRTVSFIIMTHLRFFVLVARRAIVISNFRWPCCRFRWSIVYHFRRSYHSLCILSSLLSSFQQATNQDIQVQLVPWQVFNSITILFSLSLSLWLSSLLCICHRCHCHQKANKRAIKWREALCFVLCALCFVLCALRYRFLK